MENFENCKIINAKFRFEYYQKLEKKLSNY